jgi:hypothetical protein
MQVMVENKATGPPTKVVGPITLPPLPFVAGFAGFGIVSLTCRWAAPRDGDSSYFLAHLALTPAFLVFCLLSFACVGLGRAALAGLPFWIAVVVRDVAAYLAGGWPGGWLLGTAGAALGAAAGAAAGWLFVPALVGLLNSAGGIIAMIGCWPRGALPRVARAAVWVGVGAVGGVINVLLTKG